MNTALTDLIFHLLNNKVASALVPLLFLFLGLFCINNSVAQDDRVDGPDAYSSAAVSGIAKPNSESAQHKSMISVDHSGDLGMSIPLTTIQGRKLSLPITANYKAGIKVNQKSSPIGLGWNISFGSITRDYGAFEPDYAETSVECRMDDKKDPSNINYTATSGNLSTYNNGPVVKPSDNGNRMLIYNGFDQNTADQMTPDDYHVQIPGIGSNTFWNNGGVNQSHDFKLKVNEPWMIDFDTKVYEVDQEISRINEQNFYTEQNHEYIKTGPSNSIAAAICIPPYVENRSFSEGAGKVKYKDFEEFIITTPDGVQYVFGRALRGQKYLFNEDPFWSVAHQGSTLGADASKGHFWKIDFIAEWLLTEIRSLDYEDLNQNGIADDEDSGDWIRIEYTAPTKSEQIPGPNSNGSVFNAIEVPTHREWLNFTQSDKYSSLWRERAYVTRITTPIQEVEFNTSEKFDVDHDYFDFVLNDPVKPSGSGTQPMSNFIYNEIKTYNGGYVGELKVKYPVELMRYDKITVKDRLLERTEYTESKYQKTIRFNYAGKGSSNELCVSQYLMRTNNNGPMHPYDPDKIDASTGFDIEQFKSYTGRGKTTLLGIDIRPEKGNVDVSLRKKYSFTYNHWANNFNELHKHDIMYANAWPTLRQSNTKGHTNHGETDEVAFSKLPFSVRRFFRNSSRPPSVFTNNQLIDLMGYYYNAHWTNNGRDMWSIRTVEFPDGSNYEFKYEKDDFDHTQDRQHWYIKDDNLPHIDRFNEISIMRSMAQYQVDTIIKPLGTFSMPMNSQTGGIRLKSKVYNDLVNPKIETKYEYGTGHYKAVPATYWNNYLSAFSGFLLREKFKQSSASIFSDLYLAGHIGRSDYLTYVSPLATKVRIDNSVKDDHYYEYIKEISVESNGNSSNPVIIKHFQNGNTIYTKQEEIYLKGFDNGSGKPLVSAIVNENSVASEPRLYKLEHVAKNQSNPYYKKTYTYSFNRVGSRNIISKTFNVPAMNYPLYVMNSAQTPPNLVNWFANWWIRTFSPGSHIPNTPYLTIGSCKSSFDLLSNAFVSVANTAGPWVFVDAVYAAIQNKQCIDKVSYNDYTFPAHTIRRQESVNIRLDKIEEDDHDIWKEKRFIYNSKSQLKREETDGSEYTLSSSGFNNGIHTPTIIREYTYAHEVAGTNNIFLQKNYLTLKVKDKTMAPHPVGRTDQDWTVSASEWQMHGVTPLPSATYNLISQTQPTLLGDNISSYSPFSGNATAGVDEWIPSTNNIEYNHLNQQALSKSGELFTRTTKGYNNTIDKATFQFPKKWFDATYTGFEDLYLDYGDDAMNSRKEEEFWYDQNIDRATVTNTSNYGEKTTIYSKQDMGFYLASYPTTCPFQTQVWVDNSNGKFKVGDKVVFYKNDNIQVSAPKLTDHNAMPSKGTSQMIGTISAITSNITDLTATTKPDAIAYSWRNSVAPWCRRPSEYGVDFRYHNDLICITNSASWSGFNYPPSGEMMEIVIPPNYANLSSSPDDYHPRTGNYSFKLRAKTNDADIPSKTPIRPVKIADYQGPCDPFGGSGGGAAPASPNDPQVVDLHPCDFPYMVSAWLRSGGFASGGGPGDVKASTFINNTTNGNSAQLSQLINSTLDGQAAVDRTDFLKQNSPLEDGILQEILLPTNTMLGDDIIDVLFEQPDLSDEVLSSFLMVRPKFTDIQVEDLVLGWTQYPTDNVLMALIDATDDNNIATLHNVLRSSPIRVSDGVISYLETASHLGASRGGVLASIGNDALKFKFKLWNNNRTQVIATGEKSLSVGGPWGYHEMEIPITKTINIQNLEVWVEDNRPSTFRMGGRNPMIHPTLPAYVDDFLVYPKGAKYSYQSANKFLEPISQTDANDNSISFEYDLAARLTKVYDANKRLLVEKDYKPTLASYSTKDNYIETTNYTTQNLFHKTREYFAGGKTTQVSSLNPSRNVVKTVRNTYDNLGRSEANYLPYVYDQSAFNDNIRSAAKIEQLSGPFYSSSAPFSLTKYEDNRVKSIAQVATSGNPATETTFDLSVNSSSNVNYNGASYVFYELYKETTTDPLLNVTETYKDKYGRVVCTRQVNVEQGYTFDQNTGDLASISTNGNTDLITTFEYDYIGNLLRTVDPKGYATNYRYNSRGQIIWEETVDKGITEYKYDHLGRLRFIQDAKDKQAISSGQVADQYSFITYDVWGRPTHEGKYILPLNGSPSFSLSSSINDRVYPHQYPNSQIHRVYHYDQGKLKNQINQVHKVEVFSNFSWSGSDWVASDHDRYEYEYDDNGNITKKSFELSGLADKYEISYEHNRAGLVTNQTFKNLSNSAHNFTETFTYDNFGKLVETKSGKSITSLQPDTRLEYDVFEQLKRKSSAFNQQTSSYNAISLHRQDARGRLLSSASDQFIFELEYDERNAITNQNWTNKYFDIASGPQKFTQNSYDYFYDASNKLIGANYNSQNLPANPYSNYNYDKTAAIKLFKCGSPGSGLAIAAINDAISNLSNRAAVVPSFMMDGIIQPYEGQTLVNSYNSATASLNNVVLNAEDPEYTELITLPPPALALLDSIADSLAIDIQVTSDWVSTVQAIADDTGLEQEDRVTNIIELIEIDLSQELPAICLDALTYQKDLLMLMEESLLNPELNDVEKLTMVTDLNISTIASIDATISTKNALIAQVVKLKCGPYKPSTVYTTHPIYSTPMVNSAGRKYDTEYRYRPNGNISSILRYKDNNTSFNSYSLKYYHSFSGTTASTKNRIGRVDVVDQSFAQTIGANFLHDANGNMTTDALAQNDIEYDHYNMPSKILTGTDVVTFRYNDANQRVYKKIDGVNEEYTIGHVVLDQNGVPKQYGITDGFVTMDPSGNLIREYYQKDWLGTVRATINTNGGVTSARDHYPYGQLMPGRISTTDKEDRRHQYTGHEFDEETDYGYHGARYYNRTLGRYMATDQLAKDFPSWSPYNYTMGNPINLIDPDGRFATNYVDEDGNPIGSTKDGNEGTVTVENDRVESFKESLGMLEESGLQNDPGRNASLTKRYGSKLSYSAGDVIQGWSLEALGFTSQDIGTMVAGTAAEILSTNASDVYLAKQARYFSNPFAAGKAGQPFGPNKVTVNFPGGSRDLSPSQLNKVGLGFTAIGWGFGIWEAHNIQSNNSLTGMQKYEEHFFNFAATAGGIPGVGIAIGRAASNAIIGTQGYQVFKHKYFRPFVFGE